MSNEDSPWAHQDPRWKPQSYHDAVGRDPRQPFGQPSPQAGPGPHAPSIEDYREPGRGGPPWWLVAIGVVAAIALVLVTLQVVTGEGEPTASPSPTPGATSTQSETPSSSATGGNSIPFEGNGTGVFELLQQDWTSDGLVVRFRVTLDAGRQSFGVYMFSNTTMQVSDPLDTTPFDVTAGEPYEGTATFAVEQGEATLVLTSAFGSAVTALPIKG
ncbi:hypothetical protein GCM10028820_28520 [Tessaracoccus terricola]